MDTSSPAMSRERGAASVGYTLLVSVVMLLSMSAVITLGTRVQFLLKNLDRALLGYEFQLVETGGGSVNDQVGVATIGTDVRSGEENNSDFAL